MKSGLKLISFNPFFIFSTRSVFTQSKWLNIRKSEKNQDSITSD